MIIPWCFVVAIGFASICVGVLATVLCSRVAPERTRQVGRCLFEDAPRCLCAAGVSLIAVYVVVYNMFATAHRLGCIL